MSIPLKCTQLVSYTVDFADGSGRADPFLDYISFYPAKQGFYISSWVTWCWVDGGHICLKP